MTLSEPERPWRRLAALGEVRTRWLSLIGERLADDTGAELDYWRIEKPDSVVVLTIQRHRLVLPPPSYRPGIGRRSLDLPGGRHEGAGSLEKAAIEIVRRELGVRAEEPAESVVVLDERGWAVDSSTSTQRLFGAVVVLVPDVEIEEARRGPSFPATRAGARALLDELDCLQCRAVVSEWLRRAPAGP
jgi:hypothetical protein